MKRTESVGLTAEAVSFPGETSLTLNLHNLIAPKSLATAKRTRILTLPREQWDKTLTK